jgi:hypothetical protein
VGSFARSLRNRLRAAEKTSLIKGGAKQVYLKPLSSAIFFPFSEGAKMKFLRYLVIPRIGYAKEWHDFEKWVGQTISTPSEAGVIALSLGGDRLSHCDMAVLAFEDRQLVGASALATQGRGGGDTQPVIVGVYVLPQFQNVGHEEVIIIASIHACRRHSSSPKRIIFDCFARKTVKIAEALPPNLRGHISVQDYSTAGSAIQAR